LVIGVIAIVVVAGVVIAIALLIAVITAALIAITLLVAIIATALIPMALLIAVVAAAIISAVATLLVAIIATPMPLNRIIAVVATTPAIVSLVIAIVTTSSSVAILAVAVVTTPLLPFARIRLGIITSSTPGTLVPCRDVENLSGINVVGIGQAIDFSDMIRIDAKFSANGKQGVAILDGVIKAATPTTTAVTTPIASLCFTFGSDC
jgi:hypothetical protein